MSEVEIAVLIRAANTDRDRLMFDLAYFGGLRVSKLVSLTWGQVIRRDSGEAQLSIVGKGGKGREVLIPAVIASRLFASRGDAPATAPVLRSVRRPGCPLTDRAVNFIVNEAAEHVGVNPAASIHWLRHAHASHAIDNGAPITLVSVKVGASAPSSDLLLLLCFKRLSPVKLENSFLTTRKPFSLSPVKLEFLVVSDETRGSSRPRRYSLRGASACIFSAATFTASASASMRRRCPPSGRQPLPQAQ
jgi:hypothetical protein